MLVKFVNIEGEVTALFPDELADLKGNILSYAHCGQHGGASKDWLNEPEIFDVDLFKELLSIGYNDLEVVGYSNAFIEALSPGIFDQFDIDIL